jgi:hypothetical protein
LSLEIIGVGGTSGLYDELVIEKFLSIVVVVFWLLASRIQLLSHSAFTKYCPFGSELVERTPADTAVRVDHPTGFVQNLR